MQGIVLRALALLTCAAAAAARTFDVKDAHFSVASFDGAARVSARGSAATYAAPSATAEPDDVFRLAGTLVDASGQPPAVPPQQAWVVVNDGAAAAAVWPLRVRTSGAFSWSMRVDRMPPALQNAVTARGAEWPFRVSLLVGAFAESRAAETDALELAVAELRFPAAVHARLGGKPATSVRAEAERAEGFARWPAHQHTFAQEPWRHMPPAVVSAAAALGVAVFPWFVLMQLWRAVRPRVQRKGAPAAVFAGAVIALEALAAAHWIGVSPFVVFPLVGAAVLVLLRSARESLA